MLALVAMVTSIASRLVVGFPLLQRHHLPGGGGRACYTHTHTGNIFNLQSINDTLSIPWILEVETGTGKCSFYTGVLSQRGGREIVKLYLSEHFVFKFTCFAQNKAAALWGFTACIISSNHHPGMSKKQGAPGAVCIVTRGYVPFFTNPYLFDQGVISEGEILTHHSFRHLPLSILSLTARDSLSTCIYDMQIFLPH